MSTAIALTCGRCGTDFEASAPAVEFAWLVALWERAMREEPYCESCCELLAAEREDEDAAAGRLRDEERHLRRQERSGIPPALRGLSWADLDGTGPRGEAVAAATRWANGARDGLLLSGPIGVGKTRIAATAAWARLKLGPVRWYSAPSLLALLSLSFGSPQRDAAIEALAGTAGGVLDDLDKARPTEYAAEQMFAAIDGRVAAGAPLLVTTNLSLADLAAKWPQPFGEAIASRLAGYCESFSLSGSDRRIANRVRA